MKTQMQRIIRGVRNFLFSQMNKEFLIFLFFLFLSGVFWLMMTLNETYEKEVAVPVNIVGVPKSMVVTSDVEDTLRVTVRDKGYTLVFYLYSDYIKPVKINFSTYANRQTWRGVVPQSDLQKMVSAKLAGTSKVTAVKPDKLEYYFTFGYYKKVPVRLAGVVNPGRGYYLARTQVVPDSVAVYASRGLLDSIKFVQTEPIRIVNFNDTVVRDIDMEKIKEQVELLKTQTSLMQAEAQREYAKKGPSVTEQVDEKFGAGNRGATGGNVTAEQPKVTPAVIDPVALAQAFVTAMSNSPWTMTVIDDKNIMFTVDGD